MIYVGEGVGLAWEDIIVYLCEVLFIWFDMIRRIFFLAIALTLCCLRVSAQLLWKVRGNGLQKPSYIFGTHHLAPLSVLEMVPGFQQAFDESQAIIGEIKMPESGFDGLAAQLLPYLTAPADSVLSKLLTPEEFQEADLVFQNEVGTGLTMIQTLRPVVMQSMYSMKLVRESMPDFNPAEQLDLYLQQQGAAAGKTIAGLETPELQAQLLYQTVPLDMQAHDLLRSLREKDKLVESARKLTDAYLSQDLKALDRYMNDENADTPEAEKPFMEALIVNRNKNWVKEMPELMKCAPTMFVVGAGHLPGKQGVIELLKKAGYRVTPVE